MLTIIHGSDTAQSRKNFLAERAKYPDAILLDADQINISDLTQIFEGGGLFGETKNIFIEQYLSKKKKNSDYKAILTYLEKNSAENTIFLWENKELERGALNEMKKAAVKIFKLPQTLFILLDSIQPGNYKSLIKLFHETIEKAETEMVFFMLIRQFRMLLALSNKKNNPLDTPSIDELKRLQPWQKTKLEKQANSFELAHLLTLYSNLFELEVGQKTGTLTSPLITAIDFFLLDV